jgi:cell wall-associated NlpC family hydrolase
MSRFEEIIATTRQVHAPDPRLAIFEVRCESDGHRVLVTGETSDPTAATALLAGVREMATGVPVIDQLVRLPDPQLGSARHALVRSPVAPLHATPQAAAVQTSQYVLGSRLELLSRSEPWYRVRGEDGYLGWMHEGYLVVGDHAWATGWEAGVGGEPVVALGAELVDEQERTLARLPWGARLLGDLPGQYRMPDGRHGVLASGEAVAVDRLYDRFPPRAESLLRTARRWLGAPYIWGGITPWGCDCSGFVQSVFWIHGIGLPRDSDQQARIGLTIEPGEAFADIRPGDLLFFAESAGRISHVAIALRGSEVIHCSLPRGGVAVDDLVGGGEIGQKLASMFVIARRLLPDSE